MIGVFLACAVSAQTPTFRSQSNVVLVPALVRDADGHAVYGLQQAEFIIEDDGVEQTVHLDEQAASTPLSLIVAIQTGRKAWREFPRIRGLSSMLSPVLEQEQSQIAIVEFDSGLHLVQDFTSDSASIEAGLNNLSPGNNGSAILDAVNYSVRLLAKVPEGRQRVLLLISETRDRGSHWAKIDDVIAQIGDSNTAVYALVFSPALSNILDTERGSNRGEAPDLLAPLMLARAAMKKNMPKAIAAQSGGEYELFDSRKGFEGRLIDFTNHLHSRYLLSFEPKNPRPGLHQIRVRLSKPGSTTVLARGSYWVTAPAQ